MATITIDKNNFEEEVVNSTKPVLLDFWASWCGPCRMVSPIVDEIAQEHPEIKVGKVNVDEQQELAVRFGIQSIPTILVFKNGALQASEIGVKSLASYTGLLDNLLQA